MEEASSSFCSSVNPVDDCVDVDTVRSPFAVALQSVTNP